MTAASGTRLPMLDPRHILVVRAGALGDFLLGVPVLRALRRRFPNAHISLVGPLPQAQLAHPIVDAVTSIDDPSIAALFAEGPPAGHLAATLRLSGRPADLAIIWRRRPEAVVAQLRALGTQQIIAQAPFPPPESEPIPVTEWLAASLASIDVTLPSGWDESPWLTVGEVGEVGEVGPRRADEQLGPLNASTQQVRDRGRRPRGSAGVPPASAVGRASSEARGPRSQTHDLRVATPVRKQLAAGGPATGSGRRLVVLHPGSGGNRKNWPHWAEVAATVVRRVACDLVVTGGPADEDALARFLAGYRRNTGIAPAAVVQNVDLPQLAALLERATLYLGNDSGVSHLAAAVGAPTIAVFGPTNPRIWRPRGPAVHVLGGSAEAPALLPPGADVAARWPAPAEVVAVAAALVTAGRQPGRRTPSAPRACAECARPAPA